MTSSVGCVSPISESSSDQLRETKIQCLHVPDDQINFGLYQLICLSSHIDSFPSIINYAKLFNNVEDYLKSIQQEKDEQMVIFFICDEQFISTLNHLKNIHSLYIYCPMKQDDEERIQVISSLKINDIKKHRIYTEVSLLLNDLVKDINEYIKQKRHIEPISFNIQVQNQGNTTDKTLFTWWPYFIQILCHLRYPRGNSPLIHFLKDYLKTNTSALKMLDQFEKEYTPEKTIWWYTSPTCLYEMLNRAMRQHDICLMFLFGVFIQNLYQQLLSIHDQFRSDRLSNENSLIRSYRGQVMSRDEIEELYQDNQYDDLKLAVNSILSTSLDRSVSLLFLPEPRQLEEKYVRVLLEITSDIRQQDTHPFGDISRFSSINDEAEILFMAGANFDLKREQLIYDESEELYVMKLELMDKYLMKEESYFSSFNSNEMKKFISCISLTVEHFYRASFEDINKLFDQLFDIYPSDRDWLAAIQYHCLARYYGSSNISNFEEALICYEQSRKRWLEYIENRDEKYYYSMPIGKLYHDFAFFYQNRMDDYQKADEHYDSAIVYYRLAQSSETMNDYEHIEISDKISELYIRRMDLCKDNSTLAEHYGLLAVESKKEMIELRSKLNAWNKNSEVLEITGRIARIYKSIGKHDDAVCWFEKVLQLQFQEEPICYYSINETYEEMIEMYIKSGTLDSYQSALKFQLIVHENVLKNNDLSLETDDVDDSKNEVALSHYELAKLYLLLNDQNTAKQHLIQAKTLYEETDDSHGLTRVQVKLQSLTSGNS